MSQNLYDNEEFLTYTKSLDVKEIAQITLKKSQSSFHFFQTSKGRKY